MVTFVLVVAYLIIALVFNGVFWGLEESNVTNFDFSRNYSPDVVMVGIISIIWPLMFVYGLFYLLFIVLNKYIVVKLIKLVEYTVRELREPRRNV